jgi:hypothetical protein
VVVGEVVVGEVVVGEVVVGEVVVGEVVVGEVVVGEVVVGEEPGGGEAAGELTIRNQLLGNDRSTAKPAPLRLIERFVPVIVTSSTRPPNWPRPLRRSTWTEKICPREGKRRASMGRGTSVFQECTGLAGTKSPRSATAGNSPPAVYPPVEAEYSASATLPAGPQLLPASQ